MKKGKRVPWKGQKKSQQTKKTSKQEAKREQQQMSWAASSFNAATRSLFNVGSVFTVIFQPQRIRTP